MSTVRQFEICDIRNEVKALVSRGLVGRHHRIYVLCSFFEHSDWPNVEKILEAHDYLLRDAVVDLIGKEAWVND